MQAPTPDYPPPHTKLIFNPIAGAPDETPLQLVDVINFLEICSVGLLSSLYPPADDIQHGKFARIGDLLAELVTSQPAEMRLVLGKHREINTRGHMLLAANMPYVGPHYRIAPEGIFNDGLLDVVVFTSLSKLELLSDALQMAEGRLEDPRVQSYRVSSVEIHTDPPMPVLADGVSLGQGPLRVAVQRHSLSVMAGAQESDTAPQTQT